ncbi:MAG TPA: iron-sulfur cluster assembly accessory protein [Candidatus Krumholzibacteria bacterium]|jgi:iron-sulfur cluster assembly protein
MIEITAGARDAILRTLTEENRSPDSSYLRVAVQGGGCSGMSYKLEFTDELREGDEVFRSGEARIVVDSKSMLFVHGLTLDFTTGLNGKGFEFGNPNATSTCGCGQSFKV